MDIAKVLLHTLSHLVIDQLALDAGYPASSIRERLYLSDEQFGVLLYTATADSAGSLGGIAAMAHPTPLGDALAEGRERISWCSADPVCIESEGAGTDARNLAACHCCVLLPETSCELFNSDLDRACLFGSQGREDEGFFNWAETSGYQPSELRSGTHDFDGDNVAVPIEVAGGAWEEIYKGEERLRELIEELAGFDVPVAKWGEEVAPGMGWPIELAWNSKFVAVVQDKEEDRDEWLEEAGWQVFHTEDFTPSELADRISREINQ